MKKKKLITSTKQKGGTSNSAFGHVKVRLKRRKGDPEPLLNRISLRAQKVVEVTFEKKNFVNQVFDLRKAKTHSAMHRH